jgi:4-amino-4-deoxy-L-arabinose transferase-like glycosyltransferase
MTAEERPAQLIDPKGKLHLPRCVLAWLPFLWSHVLFPGRSPTSKSWSPLALLALLALPAFLLYGDLSFHLFEPDEGRYAEIPREMLIRGEWVVPYLQSEPYLDKPPLLYWFVQISYRVFGVHNAAARLIPALSVHACIVLTYVLGRRFLGNTAALWGALLLTVAPGFVSMGRLLVLDGLLALWVTVSVLAAHEAIRGEQFRCGWWVLAALACGMGVLTKGPVAVALLVPPLWLQGRLTGRSCPVSLRQTVLFASVALAAALPWYVAICWRLPLFAWHFLWQHNVVRFLAPFDHLRPVWFYLPVLLAGLLPASTLVIPFIRFLTSVNPAAMGQRSPALGFVLLAGGWCLLFFSLSGCKLPTYVMPAYPPLCLAMGYFLANGPLRAKLWPRLALGLAYLTVGLGHNVLLPWYATYRTPLGRMEDFREYFRDPNTPIVCYPRNCDSVAFCIGRDDLRSYRSKQTNLLIRFLQQQRRTVILCSHRHSLEGLRTALTPDLKITQEKHLGLPEFAGLPGSVAERLTWLMGETTLGLCDVAVIEHCPRP